ncbi:hypothetical protein [Schaalia suimastitidis]|uniref:hypothetical protein n=1 Tax=Schaalia suimastitidis TaxID=121163 RepID=UPI00040856BB|nr:hypothetical protein [Schaalia suimastitidis]
MAGGTRRASISILNGRATLNPPSDTRKTWTINYRDPITGKPKSTSGGHTREEAEDRAAEKLGDWVPEHRRKAATPPTLREAFDEWMEAERSRWNTRTADNYSYVGERFLSIYGEQPITTITPADIAKIDLSHLSRGQQKKTRSLLKGVFNRQKDKWLRYSVEELVAAVKVTGTNSSDPSAQVRRGDIPRPDWVNSVLVCAYTTVDSTYTRRSGREVILQPSDFNRGLPDEIVAKQRRGIPNHYSDREKRIAEEEVELASRFRQYGLITALGAGGALRIGEVLALRVRHFLDEDDLDFETMLEPTIDDDTPLWMQYMGRVEVVEQASQASKGKIWLTRPKGRNGGKIRTVWLPAVLPGGSSSQFVYGRTTVREQITNYVERFADPSVSLWTMTRGEALTLWSYGYPPLAFMLWLRLTELWNSPVVQRQGNVAKKKSVFSRLLLFPTRNPARLGRDGLPNVMFAPNWEGDATIVEDTGTYQSSTNLAVRYMNPLYDYVSEEMGGYYPAHQQNKLSGRRGWTHHGLRHYAISSWLASPLVSLPKASEMAGHTNVGFTLQRYGHLFGGDDVERRGFEI